MELLILMGWIIMKLIIRDFLFLLNAHIYKYIYIIGHSEM